MTVLNEFYCAFENSCADISGEQTNIKSSTKTMVIKTHLSQHSEGVLRIWVTYGGNWRRTSGSQWTGGKTHLEASIEWTTTMIVGGPVGKVPALSPTARGCAREMACCMPRHRAMPPTAIPGGMGGRGGGGTLRETTVCVSVLLQDTIVKDTITQQMYRRVEHTHLQRSLE